MQSMFDAAYAFTAKEEGGFSENKADRGGTTAYGVSTALLKAMARNSKDAAFLKSIGVQLPVERSTLVMLTKEQAKKIFKYEFWDKNDLDIYPYAMAVVLFDMGVNHGWKNAVTIAQKGYNANIGSYGAKLVVDGIDGLKTRTALQQTNKSLILSIIERRKEFYLAIIERDPSQEVFKRGWMNRCNHLRKHLEPIL